MWVSSQVLALTPRAFLECGECVWERMAFLDDPAMIIAHIRHSCVTGDETGD